MKALKGRTFDVCFITAALVTSGAAPVGFCSPGPVELRPDGTWPHRWLGALF